MCFRNKEPSESIQRLFLIGLQSQLPGFEKVFEVYDKNSEAQERWMGYK